MPEYLSPGVYVEEIEIGAKPIEGVSTSTAGFLGETERGVTKPKLVTSWLEFQRVFGSYFGAGKYFPYGVEGFFRNGGQRCYIGRIVKSSATAASLAIKAGDNTDALTVRAIGEGSWGNRIVVKISKSTSSTFKLSLFYWKKLPFELYDPEVDSTTSPRPSMTEVFEGISLDASSPDFYETKVNSVSNLINLPKASVIKIPAAIEGTAQSGSQTTIVLSADTPANITLTGGWVSITGGTGKKQVRKITAYDSGNKTATVEQWKIAPDNTSKYQLLQYLEDGFESIELTGLAREINTNPKDSQIDLGDAASTEHDHYKNMRIEIIEGTGQGQVRKITAYDETSKIATLDEVWQTIPDNTSKYRIDNSSPAFSLADFTRTDSNTPGQKKGLTAFEEIDEISIVYSPNSQALTGLTDALIDHCELLKDRFAIIDSAKGPNPTKPRDTKYAAFYYPWVKIVDPETSALLSIPPGGYVAGIYARTDAERGVHKAPANEIVRGANSLEFTISKGEQDMLNPQGINCIRAFGGRGIRVWGARTMSSDALWKYINVRRLFLFLEESIEEGTQWVVFEPNDEKLWARVKQTIVQFLTRVWKDGALMGTTPEEAFFVKCDRTTMTQDDIDNGRLIVLIGVAPVKPAEFVIFRIAQWPGGSSTTE
jgi:phage tail sheath protein FI